MNWRPAASATDSASLFPPARTCWYMYPVCQILSLMPCFAVTCNCYKQEWKAVLQFGEFISFQLHLLQFYIPQWPCDHLLLKHLVWQLKFIYFHIMLSFYTHFAWNV
jgi:hypothetical protein